MKLKILAALALLGLTGCGYFPLRPGVSRIDGTGAYVRQSQNPQQETVQKYERVTESVPAGLPWTNSALPNSTVLRVTEKGETHIGAAQKDTAREIGAKLGALKGVVIVGLLVFLFGAVSFVYPPVKILVGGSVTTSAVITGAGLALIVLPSLLVGHELLILAVAGGAAGLYWFAHRHGSLAGIVSTLKPK
jgi:hypothetical protein